MGFLDDVQAGISRGADSAQRTARSAKLKMDANDLVKQRKELAAQLGASLYDAVKDNPEFVAGREPIFDSIAAIDAKRAQIQAELDSLEAAAAASAQAAVAYKCPSCGSSVPSTDMFCSGCGMAVADIIAAQPAQAPDAPVAPAGFAAGPVCPNCGTAYNPGDAFCMGCGNSLEASVEPVPAAPPAAEGASVEVLQQPDIAAPAADAAESAAE